MDVFISVYPFQSDVVDEALELADFYRENGGYTAAVLDDEEDVEYAVRHFDWIFREGDFDDDAPRNFRDLLEGKLVSLHGRERDIERYRGYMEETDVVETGYKDKKEGQITGL